MESNIKMHKYWQKKGLFKILASIIQIIILGYSHRKTDSDLGKKCVIHLSNSAADLKSAFCSVCAHLEMASKSWKMWHLHFWRRREPITQNVLAYFFQCGKSESLVNHSEHTLSECIFCSVGGDIDICLFDGLSTVERCCSFFGRWIISLRPWGGWSCLAITDGAES